MMEKTESDAMLAILDEEGPRARCAAYTYTRVVQENFEKICQMRKKRFSHIQIWRALKKLDVLPEYSNAHSFRQAFNREWRRQNDEKALEAFLKTDLKSSAKLEKPESAARKTQCPATPKSAQKDDDADAKARELEKIRKLAGGRTVHTLSGPVTIMADGGFDF